MGVWRCVGLGRRPHRGPGPHTAVWPPVPSAAAVRPRAGQWAAGLVAAVLRAAVLRAAGLVSPEALP